MCLSDGYKDKIAIDPHIVLGGEAFDFCVGNTALQAANLVRRLEEQTGQDLGVKIVVDTSATEFILPGTKEKMVIDATERGIYCQNMSNVIEETKYFNDINPIEKFEPETVDQPDAPAEQLRSNTSFREWLGNMVRNFAEQFSETWDKV